MSLQTRLAALITAVGADIKEVKARTPTILSGVTSVSETQQPDKAVEWRIGGAGGALLAKILAINPIVSSVVVNRSELRVRVKSRDGAQVQERLLLDSDGLSDFTSKRIWVNISTDGNPAGWFNDYIQPQYVDEGNGFVSMRGEVASDAGGVPAGRIIFRIPVGFRPTVRTTFHFPNNSTTDGTATIYPDGTIQTNLNTAGGIVATLGAFRWPIF